MLYTVLDQHVAREDCYNGYLWAPFDTLLNVPRLAQFSQDKIWYHSPFAQYVDNIALVNTSKHPPPARISPDPYGNVGIRLFSSAQLLISLNRLLRFGADGVRIGGGGTDSQHYDGYKPLCYLSVIHTWALGSACLPFIASLKYFAIV